MSRKQKRECREDDEGLQMESYKLHLREKKKIGKEEEEI